MFTEKQLVLGSTFFYKTLQIPCTDNHDQFPMVNVNMLMQTIYTHYSTICEAGSISRICCKLGSIICNLWGCRLVHSIPIGNLHLQSLTSQEECHILLPEWLKNFQEAQSTALHKQLCPVTCKKQSRNYIIIQNIQFSYSSSHSVLTTRGLNIIDI